MKALVPMLLPLLAALDPCAPDVLTNVSFATNIGDRWAILSLGRIDYASTSTVWVHRDGRYAIGPCQPRETGWGNVPDPPFYNGGTKKVVEAASPHVLQHEWKCKGMKVVVTTDCSKIPLKQCAEKHTTAVQQMAKAFPPDK